MMTDDKRMLDIGPDPEDEFGPVRERRDFSPLQISMHHVLPLPFRDLTYTDRTGWRYYPQAGFEDRLGLARAFTDQPTPGIKFPAWADRTEDVEMCDDTERQESRGSMEKAASQFESFKRKRQDEASTITAETFVSEYTKDSYPRGFFGKETSRPTSAVKPNLLYETQKLTLASREASVASFQRSDMFPQEAPIMPPVDAKLVNSIQPTVCHEKPKQLLYAWYGTKPRRLQLPKNCFLSWSNNSQTNPRYSSLFVCPVTKETFLAGRCGNVQEFDMEGNVVWYTKKMSAEHAVAARAFDCWNLRENCNDRSGYEQPYHQGHGPPLPVDELPSEILEKLEDAKHRPCPVQPLPNMPGASNVQPVRHEQQSAPHFQYKNGLTQGTESELSYPSQRPINDPTIDSLLGHVQGLAVPTQVIAGQIVQVQPNEKNARLQQQDPGRTQRNCTRNSSSGEWQRGMEVPHLPPASFYQSPPHQRPANNPAGQTLDRSSGLHHGIGRDDWSHGSGSAAREYSQDEQVPIEFQTRAVQPPIQRPAGSQDSGTNEEAQQKQNAEQITDAAPKKDWKHYDITW